MKYLLFLFPIILILLSLFIYFDSKAPGRPNDVTLIEESSTTVVETEKIKPQPTTTPIKKLLANDYQIFQTFNNCGPASLSMALSYYGIHVSQNILGDELRPYQVAGGDNDDKSVTFEELAEKANDYSLIAYHRPSGDIGLIKQFINLGVPVIAKTWTKENEDIGHFRVVKGYDDTTREIIQDDSLQGKNLKYSYELFNKLWEKFNYEYLVLIPPDKKETAEKILGENADQLIAWKKAVELSREELRANPDNIYARFNLSVAFFRIGEYQQSVNEFEKIENKLPFRTLWYQIEPIKAYFELKNYQRVMDISEKILNNHNRAFSELYMLRGEVHLAQNNPAKAKEEFELALRYNVNLKGVRETLDRVSADLNQP